MPAIAYHHKYMRPRDYGKKLLARKKKPKAGKKAAVAQAAAPGGGSRTAAADRRSGVERGAPAAQRKGVERPATARSAAVRPKAATAAPSAMADTKAQGAKKTLDRILSKAGLGSRTEAAEWIRDGRVKVNGKAVSSIEMWIDPKRDKVTLDGAPVREGAKLYILLNKPKGYLTTYKDPEGRPTVYQLLKGVPGFVGTAGRLDMDTSGLLILTNDNGFADFITSPSSHVPKTYLVKSSSRLSDEKLDALRKGVELDDGPTRPALVTRLRDSEKYTHFEITITEGRNRQVRRMVEAIGSKVLKLVRVSIGPISLAGLAMGAWRALTAAEVRSLIERPEEEVER